MKSTARRNREPQPKEAEVAQTRALRPGLLVGVLAAVVLFAGGVYFALIRMQSGLNKPPAEPEPVATVEGEPAVVDKPSDSSDMANAALLAIVRARGEAMPLPPTLLTKPNEEERFWYVGMPSTESLVEIPFMPGLAPGPPPQDAPLHANPGFLGADACKDCHREKYDSFIHTSHHLTSSLATTESVMGSFELGRNLMQSVNPDVKFTMVERDSRLYQRVDFYGWQFEVPFDIVFGSSKLAQTFLFWNFDALYQMNVTYLATNDQWVNSPGYIDGDAAYARPIGTRCFECHTTYAEIRERPNRYTPSSVIFGISCERCHGPGASHVAYHRANPGAKVGNAMTVPSKLSRERELDVCGQCHSGASPLKKPPYSFRPGDRLDDFYEPLPPEKIANSVHVSNQAVRLSLSKCFKQSDMSCSTCHDPHRNERGKLDVYSARCMECHSQENCGEFARMGERIKENCIDCHMPNESTVHLPFDSPEGKVFPPLRDHHVRIDEKATEKFRETKK